MDFHGLPTCPLRAVESHLLVHLQGQALLFLLSTAFILRAVDHVLALGLLNEEQGEDIDHAQHGADDEVAEAPAARAAHSLEDERRRGGAEAAAGEGQGAAGGADHRGIELRSDLEKDDIAPDRAEPQERVARHEDRVQRAGPALDVHHEAEDQRAHGCDHKVQEHGDLARQHRAQGGADKDRRNLRGEHAHGEGGRGGQARLPPPEVGCGADGHSAAGPLPPKHDHVVLVGQGPLVLWAEASVAMVDRAPPHPLWQLKHRDSCVVALFSIVLEEALWEGVDVPVEDKVHDNV
mmetsp:Transcript_96425/g.281797  ORF Transcript_96425/g.281797 Transcript_96425/m.281797 type:complete len:293 (+) Transcript_96425:122-1000(+)